MYPVKRAVLAAIAAAVTSCGGETDPPLPLKELAVAQQAAATSKAQSGPCTNDSQCSYVTFFEPYYSCSQGIHVPYLKTSRTAAWLVEAAKEQRETALRARDSEPLQIVLCIQSVEVVNSVCLRSNCTITLGGSSLSIDDPAVMPKPGLVTQASAIDVR